MKGARGRGRPFTVDHWPSGSSLQSSDCDIAVSTTPADWFDHWRLFDIRQPRSRNFLTLCNLPRKRSPTPFPLLPVLPVEKSHLNNVFALSLIAGSKDSRKRRGQFSTGQDYCSYHFQRSPSYPFSLLCESYFNKT